MNELYELRKDRLIVISDDATSFHFTVRHPDDCDEVYRIVNDSAILLSEYSVGDSRKIIKNLHRIGDFCLAEIQSVWSRVTIFAILHLHSEKGMEYTLISKFCPPTGVWVGFEKFKEIVKTNYDMLCMFVFL